MSEKTISRYCPFKTGAEIAGGGGGGGFENTTKRGGAVFFLVLCQTPSVERGQ